MKPITIISTALLLAVAGTSQAQFLNKLKKKAERAVTKAVVGSSSSDNNENPDNASEGGDVQGNSPSSTVPASAAIEKYGKQLFTLQDKEYLVYGEVSLSLKTDGAHVKTVTHKDRDYYLYDNGTRQGPFNKPPVHLLDDWNRSYDAHSQNEDFEEVSGTSYVSAGVFEVDGKSYGKVTTVGTMRHNKKAKKFYALVIKMEPNTNKITTFLYTEKGTRKLPGMATTLIISDNGQTGGVIIPATQYNAKTDQDAYNFVLNDDVYIALADGTTLGPYKYVEASDSYLDNHGNYVQIATSTKNAIYVNGKPVITFTDKDVESYGAFLTNTKGTSGAWFDRGTLYFSDGTKIKNAVQPVTAVEGGKDVIYWVAIHKSNVYLCKKEI
ncbi:hypothetical protein EOD41_19090 [Mucilaginibacter limnophilus]|uniref:WG repeat-containing protein n=1 Tax=Mucilaginibacter limnophilus TaxID=1932778 RepID=A0A437MI04_9SPHI|nr:hypothetical protein [Mucilaginibacter limnophilus]RVT97271.1 hypothetical protein EOD41_19090 [Mucilaginibacter limnophilus]